MIKPKLFIHVGEAGHFLSWERPIFSKFFDLVDAPSSEAVLLAFGPDVIESGAHLPALARVGYILPGFGYNPVYNLPLRSRMREIAGKHYGKIFINPGPLELAYGDMDNVVLCPFGICADVIGFAGYRSSLNSLLHVSHDSPQKDWQRSRRVMQLTGLEYEVFPPRKTWIEKRAIKYKRRCNKISTRLIKRPVFEGFEDSGYVSHQQIVEKYQSHDAFVHVAKDVKSPIYIDGKYTAALLEAGMTGAILFWHDTFSLGNGFETIFSLPLDPRLAAEEILNIRQSLNVRLHSQRTREEMLAKVSADVSVAFRCEKILSLI